MDALFRLSGGMRDNPEVDEWLSGEPDALYIIARELFAMIRA